MHPTYVPTAKIVRCCDSHPDWATLGRHLTQDFPTVEPRDVLLALSQARWATQGFGLRDGEAVEAAELIARHQLLLLTGQIPDAAHLDPQVHPRRETADSS
jgi:hypothetical protein